jgi:hypothetical protein
MFASVLIRGEAAHADSEKKASPAPNSTVNTGLESESLAGGNDALFMRFLWPDRPVDAGNAFIMHESRLSA